MINETNEKKYTKGDLRYWEARVHSTNGHNWNCFFQHDGERKHLSLPRPADSAEKSDKSRRAFAAKKAKEIHAFLIANGWAATLAKFWPKAESEQPSGVTVGTFIEAVRKNGEIKSSTRTGYETCFRQIVSDIFKLGSEKERYDYKTGGRDAWLAKVNAVRLADITPARVQQWKVRYVSRFEGDEVAQRRAQISCTTTLRQAKGLFSTQGKNPMLPKLKGVLELPSPLPFSEVKGYGRQSLKYQGGIDIDQLIQDAETELAPTRPEEFKIFLLGCMAGLRRKEIDLLEWSSFLWKVNEIEIKPTTHFTAKAEDSYGKIKVDPELMEAFRGYRATAKANDFVIKSGLAQIKSSWNRYRQAHFEKLAGWLREHGIEGNKPIHVLRKEFGSRINANGGIHAASTQLRHADIGITAQFYVDDRKRVTTGFGHLFKGELANIVENVKFGTDAA